MLNFSLTSNCLPKARAVYKNRMRKASWATAHNNWQMHARLRSCQTAEQVFQAAAATYTKVTRNASMFVALNHQSLGIEVMSLAGELGEGKFPTNDPAPLMSYVLAGRFSIHLPAVHNISQARGQQRREDNMHVVEVTREDSGVVSEHRYPDQLVPLLPKGFNPERGSVLITPLGEEGIGEKAFGFIYEYQPENSFWLGSIRERYVYASLFAYQIAANFEIMGE